LILALIGQQHRKQGGAIANLFVSRLNFIYQPALVMTDVVERNDLLSAVQRFKIKLHNLYFNTINSSA